MQQMVEAVDTIHEERIVHSDLEPANFLLVKGSLKLIIDFESYNEWYHKYIARCPGTKEIFLFTF